MRLGSLIWILKCILCPSVGGRTVPLVQASLLWGPKGLNTAERA